MRIFILLMMAFLFSIGTNTAQSLEGISLKNVNTSKMESAYDIFLNSISVIIFVDDDCPYIDSYKDRIKGLSMDVLSSGYNMIFINPHEKKKADENSVAQMKKSMSSMGWKGTMYSDADQMLVKQLGATKLPEVFIIKSNGKQAEILFRGAIDDNPQSASQVNQQYAMEALALVKKNGSARNLQSVIMGCRIKKF